MLEKLVSLKYIWPHLESKACLWRSSELYIMYANDRAD